MRIALGTQGWSYADWAGDMYDAAARPESYLRAYAEEFSTVEIDSTWYAAPSPGRVRAWAAAVPEGFSFSCKLPREITHDRRLADCGGRIRAFYDVVRHFGGKLGCVLAQFDAGFGRGEEAALRAALPHFPQGVRTAFEFRDAAWYEPAIAELLAEYGHALAVADAPFVPFALLPPVLARGDVPFAYVRWIGDHNAFDRFDRVRRDRTAEIRAWAEAIAAASPRIERVYGYVNNHYQGHSPATVRALAAALGVARERPHRVRQPSLFGVEPGDG